MVSHGFPWFSDHELSLKSMVFPGSYGHLTIIFTWGPFAELKKEVEEKRKKRTKIHGKQ